MAGQRPRVGWAFSLREQRHGPAVLGTYAEMYRRRWARAQQRHRLVNRRKQVRSNPDRGGNAREDVDGEVRDTDGTPLPLVDVRTDLPRVPDPQF
jgi:hypothetical protein